MAGNKKIYVSIKEACRMFGLTRSYINSLRKDDEDFAERCIYKVSERKVLVRVDRLIEWIERQNIDHNGPGVSENGDY